MFVISVHYDYGHSQLNTALAEPYCQVLLWARKLISAWLTSSGISCKVKKERSFRCFHLLCPIRVNKMNDKNNAGTAFGFAILAAILWSGNFIAARALHQNISPVSLAFFRWLIATVLILPIAWKQL